MKLLKDILEHKTGTSPSDFVMDGSKHWPPTAQQKKKARKKTDERDGYDPGYDPHEYELNLEPLKTEEQLNELGPLSIIGLGAGAIAAHDILKLHFSKKARDHREKLSRFHQRLKDRADPRSKLNKDMRRKQQTRNRHIAKIASTLEPGETVRKSFTKKSWAASDSKYSNEPSKKGVRITRNSDGTIKVRYENTIHEGFGHRFRVHKNPPPERLRSLISGSTHGEMKMILHHPSGDLHVWDGAEDRDGNAYNHGDVIDMKGIKGRVSGATIDKEHITHSGEWSSMGDHSGIKMAGHDEFTNHKKIKEIVDHLGLEHRED